MEKYISDLISAISYTELDTTYKMSWARALVELCLEHPGRRDFHLDEFSLLVFEYYWNQTIFFNLQQGPSALKRLEIPTIVLEAIDKYRLTSGPKPETFIRASHAIEIPTRKISSVLARMPCPLFLKFDKRVIDTYTFDSKRRIVHIKHPRLIKDHADILFQLINYRWAQKLEDTDGSPRIAKKIRGVDRGQRPARGSTAKFKRYLDIENPGRVCFHSGKPIASGNVAIDHVIPWSYLYADDLWNLVYVDCRENSAKGNRIPDEATIVRLEQRNRSLLETLQQQGSKSKHVAELKIAIDRDYVRRFWIGCRG